MKKTDKAAVIGPVGQEQIALEGEMVQYLPQASGGWRIVRLVNKKAWIEKDGERKCVSTRTIRRVIGEETNHPV